VTDVFEQIEAMSGVVLRKDELLSHHTTFGVGGPCDLMAWVSNKQALLEVQAPMCWCATAEWAAW
jgi:hypothetical protein